MGSMRCLLALAVVSGCASGSSPNAPLDGQQGQDAPKGDAPAIDAAPPIDGQLVDAAPNIDGAPPVDAALTPDACVPTVTELLVNASFDNAAITPWTEIRYDATIPLIGAFSFTAQSGTKYAWLGGYDDFGFEPDDYVYQNIVVPALTSQIVVTGYLAVGTDDSATTVYDQGLLGFLFPNTPTTTPIIIVDVDNTDAATLGAWTPFSQTIVTPLSGQTLRFQMETHNDISLPSSFLFDTLSVKATHGCP